MQKGRGRKRGRRKKGKSRAKSSNLGQDPLQSFTTTLAINSSVPGSSRVGKKLIVLIP